MARQHTKWHITRREKPEQDRIVIGYWDMPDDDSYCGFCYIDQMGHWYLAQEEPGAETPLKQPKYWIEHPKRDFSK